VIEEIFGRLRPEAVVYVSCNPEALARDLHEAAAFRYVIEAVQPVTCFRTRRTSRRWSPW
jgi:tRNA/tmRNA/rRNA uracil-C5-methylase (TrmA/RlmC/RlmD family)